MKMSKRVSLYGIFCAAAIVFGYIETLLPTDFIAPGIKPGLANSAALMLLLYGDFKGALLVNIARICLSAMLFGTPMSLLFSLTAGIASLIAMRLLKNVKCITAIGFSVAGAAMHNTVQSAVAAFIYGAGIWYYYPVLLLIGTVSGTVIGIICLAVFKKIETNAMF